MSSIVIESHLEGKTTVESFFIEEETDYAIEMLENMSLKYLGKDTEPYEDGSIGYYSSNGNSIVLRVF